MRKVLLVVAMLTGIAVASTWKPLTRRQLEKLDKAELVERVLLCQDRIERQQDTIDRLDKELRRLRRDLR